MDPLAAVNMFALDILQPLNFSAITVASPFGITDTALALFDSTGVGVYLNDDIDGGNTLSCLPSQSVTVNLCASTAPANIGPLAVGDALAW